MRQVLLLFTWIAPAIAQAQQLDYIDEGGTQRAGSPNLSLEMSDPTGRTRFHLTTRFTFSNTEEAFGRDALATLEASAVIRAFEGFGISFGIPFALDAPRPGNDQLLLGNLHLGVEGGGVIRFGDTREADPDAPRLGIGGAFDFYAPTGRSLEDQGNESERMSLVRRIRSFEQELYLERTAAFRIRAHVDFTISIVTAELELGLSPAVTAQSEADFLMLFLWGARLGVRPIEELEPFLEVGHSMQIAGEPLRGYELDEPVLLTVGLRGHFGIDPALFVTFDLAEGGVIFGVDIAAAFRAEHRAESIRDPLDFEP
jgi:hypothetical protein